MRSLVPAIAAVLVVASLPALAAPVHFVDGRHHCSAAHCMVGLQSHFSHRRLREDFKPAIPVGSEVPSTANHPLPGQNGAYGIGGAATPNVRCPPGAFC